jgi:hypothetical protein
MDDRTGPIDECALRERAREAIDRGALPRVKPNRTYGGPGSAKACAVCGVVVQRSEMEIELEFTRQEGAPSDCYHLHPRCFAAWDSVARVSACDPAAGPLRVPKSTRFAVGAPDSGTT